MTRGGYHPNAYPWRQVKPENRPARVRERVSLRDVGALVALLRHDAERRGTSENAIRTYAAGVRAFLTWAWQTGRDVLDPDPDLALDWTRHLERRGASAGTITTYRAAVSALYRAFRWAGATTADPMRDAPRVRDPVPRHEKRRPYSETELRALLAAATPDERVFLLLSGLGGLRNAEARAARWADVDWHAGTLLVKGKGGKVRRVYLGRDVLLELREAHVRAGGDFVLRWRDPDTLRGKLKALCHRAGVPYEGRAFHGLRHTAGTVLYRRTRNLDDVARHLGHSQIETSRVYAEHENSATRDALDGFEIS
ncbi:integrase family protein (plasmid) [Deinococcus geothermalis DSM 11300]|uniref:Integrase family protein n=1 Tax=Deinococcus geothermalis (strain DSM 11300 / CIP 105573 / AG-3a) TaxID=319795 RepID=A8ZRH8_DEIGD|nr:tyrosine-type recombinase/integrase [Deinococcus geothermalis]ABW35087.1 integrase family protein [Deinococcus geothermalis DSM 11300]